MSTARSFFRLLLLIGLLTASLSAMTIDEAMTAYVIDHYNLDPATTQVEILSSGIKLTELNPTQFAIKPMTDREPIGLMSFLCSVTDSQHLSDKGQVQVRIRRFADAFVATQTISRASTLSQTLFESKQIEITNIREQLVTDLSQFSDYRIRRNLIAGQPLTVEALELMPTVETGQDVSITYEEGVVRLSASGQALQNGRVGELIRVRNKASGKLLYATIVSRSQVSVTP